MDCKEKVKQKKSAGKEKNCKICVKRQRSFGKEDFYENEVKRQQNSGKAELCKDGVKRQQEVGKVVASGIGREAAASARGEEAGDNTRQVVDGNRRQKKMVEEEGRQMAENSIPRGKAQKAAPARRKGTFYLWLAAWWPTVAGRKRWARKGVERRLEALEESQNCAAKV